MPQFEDMLQRSVVTAFVSLSLVALCSGSGWGYEGHNAPSEWKNSYPDCRGHRQSPINIITDDLILSKDPRPVWNNYNLVPATVLLTNNGHSLQLKAYRQNPNDGMNPQLVIGSKVYQLDQTHFHFGKTDNEGSEHSIDYRRFPLEMHSVHRRVVNGTEVSSPEVIVTTILFEISPVRNPGLDTFVTSVEAVKRAEDEVEIEPFPMDTLIPQFDTYFYSYEGSLTTPPCSEVVTFFIREKPAIVSHRQLELLRTALNAENKPIAGNFRPLQDLNGRKVFFSVL